MTSLSLAILLGRAVLLQLTEKMLDRGRSFAPVVAGRAGFAGEETDLLKKRERLAGGSRAVRVVVDALLCEGGSWTREEERLSRSL